MPPVNGARLVAVSHAVPNNVLTPSDTLEALGVLYPDEEPSFLQRLIEGAGIGRRYLVPSVEEVLSGADFGARNDRYLPEARALAAEAAARALDRAGLLPEEVDCVVDVSCTGIAIPALDVDLVPSLGLSETVRRIPITESGCAAGALGLGLAASLAAGGEKVLLVAVELCSLTLCPGDQSRASLVSSVLFGDGAAAAVVLADSGDAEGPSRERPTLRFEAVGSHLIPESRETMGFDVGPHGLRIVLHRELPQVLRDHLGQAIDVFLARHGRTRADVSHHLVHPGGRRILEGSEELLGLAPEALDVSRRSLERFGNLSSASILTVLELFLESPPRDGTALVTAVGPGLSLEFALLAP